MHFDPHYHYGGWIVFPHRSPLTGCCVLYDRGYPSVGNFDSTLPIDVVGIVIITITFPGKQIIMKHDMNKFILTQFECRIQDLINLLGPVAQRADNTIQRINGYLADK